MIKVGDKVRRDCKGCFYQPSPCPNTPEVFIVYAIGLRDRRGEVYCGDPDCHFSCPVEQLTLVKEELTIKGNTLCFKEE